MERINKNADFLNTNFQSSTYLIFKANLDKFHYVLIGIFYMNYKLSENVMSESL